MKLYPLCLTVAFTISAHPAGASEGIAPPAEWHLEYLANGTASNRRAAILSQQLTGSRSPFALSGNALEHAAVAVQEWEALTPK